MAQILKISLVRQSGENVIITLNENETFQEFQTRILREYSLYITTKDHFTGVHSDLSPDGNFYKYFTQHISTNIENQNNSGVNIEKSSNNVTIIKDESNPYVISKTPNNVLYSAFKEVQNLDTSLIVLDNESEQLTTVLTENIFSSDYQILPPNTEKKTDSQEITLYGGNDNELISNYQLMEDISAPKMSETNINENQDMAHTNENNRMTDNNHDDKQLSEESKTSQMQKNINSNGREMESNNGTYNYMDIESKLREIHSYNEENLSDLCRLCAKTVTENSKIRIYSSEKLEEKINNVLPIKITSEDGLPQYLCQSCLKQVTNYHNFVNSVLEADKLLKLKFLNIQCIRENSPTNTSSEFISEYLDSSPEKNNTKSDDSKITCEKDAAENYETEYLEMDMDTQNSDLDLKCRLCDFVLDNLEDSILHSIQSHNLNGLYVCTLCEYCFTSTVLLTQHAEQEHRKSIESNLRKDKNRIQCGVCSKKFVSQAHLQKHTCAKATTNKTLHCEVCNQSFPTKIRLNFHRQFHLKDARPLFCAICNITFDDENVYFDHVNFLHDSKHFVCDICGKCFNSQPTLNNHKKTHTGTRNYQCDICHKSYIDKQTLKEHEVSHMSTKPYQCHVCGKKINRLSRLKKHLLTHESNPSVNDIHVCSHCKETFANDETAKLHLKNQLGDEHIIEIISTDKVFRCEFCEKCYSSCEALDKHRTEHGGSTPYICHICKAQFSSYSRCISHKTTHGLHKDGVEKDNYPVVKHFLCEHCGKSYLHWTYLSLHRRLKHSDNAQVYKCSNCEMKFTTSWALTYHRKSKHHQSQFKCLDCGQILPNLHALKLHRLGKHSDKKLKDTQCDKCGKIFAHLSSLEVHMKCHQSAKEYKCSLCPKRFVHSSGLSNHLKLHREKKHLDKQEFTSASGLVVLRNKITNPDRPFVCDECGLSFRRQFSLKNHKLKHNKVSESNSFVLMVDMKEDTSEPDDTNSNALNNPAQLVETVMPENASDTYIQLAQNETNEMNYIVNIDGEDYIIIKEEDNTVNKNQEFQMIVDDTINAESEQQLVAQQEYNSGTVTLVESDNTFIVNQNQVQVHPEYIFTTTDKAGTTYVIGDHCML